VLYRSRLVKSMRLRGKVKVKTFLFSCI